MNVLYGQLAASSDTFRSHSTQIDWTENYVMRHHCGTLPTQCLYNFVVQFKRMAQWRKGHALQMH